MATLHGYILRELLKTFGLALTALTALFTMGGGLYNVVRFEGVSAADVFSFIPLMIPIVVTLTMPMAALFAATMVYGRLAADNELTACRAAGINVHRLLLSCVLLSVLVAAFTLLFSNFVIPQFMQRLDDFARNNVRDIVAQQLQQKGFIHRGKTDDERYTFTAERVQGVTDDALRSRHFEVDHGLQYLLVSNPTGLHVDRNGDLQRFFVAKHVLCAFDTRVTPLQVTLYVREGQDFEVGKRAMLIDQQQIGPFTVPMPVPQRLSSTDLPRLLRWHSAPWETPRLADQIQTLRYEILRERLFAEVSEQIKSDRGARWQDEQRQEYLVTARETRTEQNHLVLQRGRVEVRSPEGAPRAAYEAERMELSTLRLPGRTLMSLRLVQTAAQDVLEYDLRAGATATPRHKDTLNIDQLVLPDEVVRELEDYTPAALVTPSVALPIDAQFGDNRVSLGKAAAQMKRKIVATLNFRMGYTSSVLVTLVMGAALGIIFRGSRALAAFALALIPFFSVLFVMMLGRQLTEDMKLTDVGPWVTWGGLALGLVADGVILRLGVRR